jgi:hypothetical protein
VVLVGRVRILVGGVGAELDQRVQALGRESELATSGGDGGEERLPRGRLQAAVQGPAAVRVDVDPVALEPVGPRMCALVDGHRHTRPTQALCQAQPADAATDDQYSR